MTARPAAFPQLIETIRDVNLSDSGNADYFEREVDGTVAFDHAARRWFMFSGDHWHEDTVQQVQERAVETMRNRQHEALLLADSKARESAVRHALRSEGRRQIADMLGLAQSRPTIAVDGTQWDRDPMLFGVTNGVIDLDRAVLRCGTKSDRITKVAPVRFDPDARCPRFERFLTEVFRPTPDVVPYLQRVLGYSLTGDTSEQQFWIWWGTGGNGKSTLLKMLLQHIFGDRDASYAWAMPFPTAQWSAAITEYQRAELPGRRLVAASEVRGRAPLNEDFIKSLTGGDQVNARHPYGRPFNFVPDAKFVLLCNDKPIIRDLTTSMWRRLRLIPFTEQFPVDTTLARTLATEAPGILNWLMEGCRLWQREGLGDAPAAVRAATDAYREDSDLLLEFYTERCVRMPGVSVKARVLFDVYRHWCDTRHLAEEDRLTQKTFGLRVKERHPDCSSSERQVIYSGIGLATESRGE